MLAGCGSKVDFLTTVPNPVATVTMSNGSEMRFELYVQDAPNTVANFVELANAGYYDGQYFYRIVPGVLIQTGDRSGEGTADAGYTIQGEFADNGIENPVNHTRGTIVMARQPSNMNSASCQFFIMQGSYPEYNGKYAAFGRAMDDETLKAIDSIASIPVDGSHRPTGTYPTIKTIRVNTHGYSYEAAKIKKDK